VNKSESIQNLAKALVGFQSEVKNPANTANNPFFKSKYAPLPEILNDVRPLLSKHGLSLLQAPSGDGDKIVITTLLMHESGEWIETCPLILKADKATAQGAGSAITYGRRYALSAILGISSEDDDDGNQATKTADKKPPTPPKTVSQKPTDAPTKVNFAGFWVETKKLGFTREQVHQFAGVESISGWTKPQVDMLYKQLKKVKEEEAKSA